MATGFMGFCWAEARLHSIVLLLALALAGSAAAAEVSLVGLYSGKALVVIDGGRPRSIPVGSTSSEGVKLLAIDDGVATFEVDGRRQRLRVGQNAVSTGDGGGGEQMVTLMADPAGHFVTVGSINGASVRLLVDTGATFVSMGVADAVRANIDYQKGTPAMMMTANGAARAWQVKLNSIRVGDVALTQVDAVVHESNLPVVLLGMSFLNRMEMKRDGQSMTLKKRF
jgi:aspartyl protease family protein